MAHEIYNTDGIALARVPAWHHLGTVLDQDFMTAHEAMQYAGLDWSVTQEPMHLPTGRLVPNHVANVRSDNGDVIGVVGSNYVPTQNASAFSFMDELQGGGVRYDVAGSLQGGRKVFLVARLDRDVMIGGDPDETIEPYIVLANGHDGSLALTVYLTPIRVVCMNTLRWSLAKASNVWKARHTRNVESRMNEARRTLGMANGYFDTLQEVGDTLIATSMTLTRAQTLASRLFEVPADATDKVKANSAERAREVIQILATADNLANVHNTAWGFAQAVTEWEDYSRNYRDDDTRFQAVVMGAYPNSVKAKGLALALAEAR